MERPRAAAPVHAGRPLRTPAPCHLGQWGEGGARAAVEKFGVQWRCLGCNGAQGMMEKLRVQWGSLGCSGAQGAMEKLGVQWGSSGCDGEAWGAMGELGV